MTAPQLDDEGAGDSWSWVAIIMAIMGGTFGVFLLAMVWGT